MTLNFKHRHRAGSPSFPPALAARSCPSTSSEEFTGANARDADFNLNPVGTGPYKVTEFRPGDVVIYEINENYREADKPYFKQIELKGGGDATGCRACGAATGETDWAWNLQVESAGPR